MANLSSPFDKELVDVILGYQYKNSPFEKGITKSQLEKLSPRFFSDVLDQIWEKITTHLHKKHDEVVFQLISKSVSCSSIEDFLENGSYELQMNPKTLKNSLVRGSGSERVHDLFKAFSKVVEIEYDENANLKRVQGFFNIYNLHNTNRGRFQVSNLCISLNENDCNLTYFSRRYKKETKRVELEIIGNDKLLVKLTTEDNCFLAFYAFIGAMTHPKIIQAVFIYNNGLGQTISSLAIFEKVDSYKKLVEPQRECEDLSWIPNELVSAKRKSIFQHFLLNRGKVLKPSFSPESQSIKFNIDDLDIHPGPYGERAFYYEDTKQYIGKYYIFFNERYPSVNIENKRLNDFYSTVGEGLFEIYLDSKDGRFRCKMKTKKNEKKEVIEHDGYIINDRLKSPSYLIISMYEKNYRHRYINILLMKTGGEILLGSHNIMYSRVGKLGVGSVVVVRAQDDFDFDKDMPKSLYPCPPNNKPLRDTIVNYLSRNSNALLSPVTDTGTLFRKFKDLIHSGIYKMYSYNKNGMRVGILEINKTGFVTHTGISGGKETVAYGHASQIRSVLNILLKNRDNERTGFCSVKVTEIPPTKNDSANSKNRDKNTTTVYVGTFCGVTRRDGEFPLASKIILEYMGQAKNSSDTLSPQIIERDSPEYLEIPLEIKNALSIREQSFIDFQGIRRGIYKLADLKEFNDDYSRRHRESIQSFALGNLGDLSNLPGKAKEEISVSYYERAVYHAVIKNDTQKAISLFKEAKRLTLYPNKIEEQFRQEIQTSANFDSIASEL